MLSYSLTSDAKRGPHDDENADSADPTPEQAREQLEQALFEIRRIIAGQDAMLERVLVCLLAQGHSSSRACRASRRR